MTPPPEAQLDWLTVALEELPAFLASPDTFRPLHSKTSGMAEDLSLGRLLLVVDALQASEADLTIEDRARWDRGRVRWEAEGSKRPSALEAKARGELPHRINLWRAYLQDLVENPNEAAAYASEVRHRVIIERLGEVQASRSALAQLDRLDATLRTWLVPGRFVWEDNLQSTYPPARFWYLYGRPSRPTPLPPSGRGGG